MGKSRIHYEDVLGSAMTDKRVEVLRSIHQAGSISEAARANGVSYKAAWQAVETLGNLAGVPLIEKAVGGSGGGGARLTPEGLQVLRAADLLNDARKQALSKIRAATKGGRINLSGVVGVGLRTSMRNQLPCTVKEIKKSQGAARISMQLADGQLIVSRITLESLQLLGLSPGMQVLALCKATAVTVAAKIVTVGGVNLLHGKIVRRAGAGGVAEVSLQLAPGLGLVGFADQDSGLKLRQTAMAAIEESAVVIGLIG